MASEMSFIFKILVGVLAVVGIVIGLVAYSQSGDIASSDPLSKLEIEREIEKAHAGNRESYAKLSEHYSLYGDQKLAKEWYTRCLQIEEASCLSDEASWRLGDAESLEIDDPKKRQLLLDARAFAKLAIKNAYPEKPKDLDGMRHMARLIEVELEVLDPAVPKR
jgi:hypothetical protein